MRIPFFCTNFAPAFSYREASVILAQTRCCDSQSNVQYLEGHCLKGGKAEQRSDKSEDLLCVANGVGSLKVLIAPMVLF